MVARVSRRLLVIVHPYPPVPSVGSNRWGAMVKYLRRLGHQVTVVTTGAFGRLPGDAEADTVRTADLMGSERLRRMVGLGPLARPGTPSAATPPVPAILTQTIVPDAFLLSWAPMALLAAVRAVRSQRFDCVITSAPSESTHFIGLALHRRGLPWVADFRDGWVFEPYRTPMPTTPQRALDHALERAIVQRADAVVAATKPIAEDFRRRLGVPAAHVPNGWDPDLEAHMSLGGAGNTASAVRLVHTGKLTGLRGRDPGVLFEALRHVVADDPALGERLELLLAGPQDHEDARAIAESGLDGVIRYIGHLERTDALRLQRTADALVLLTSRDVGEAPGKLYEYLATGRPILALAAENEAERIIRETRTGVAVDPDDVEGVATAVKRTASGELAADYAPSGLDAYTYPRPAEAVLAAVEQAIERRRLNR